MKDSIYFPHYANTRNDLKIRRVRRDLGLESYAIYFMILEVLREQDDFRYPISDIDLLAEDFKTSESKVKVIIYNYDLFKVSDDYFFRSLTLDDSLGPLLEKRRERSLSGIKGNLKKYYGIDNDFLEGFTEDETILLSKELKERSLSDPRAIARKFKKEKINKIKEIKGNVSNDKNPDFSDFQKGDLMKAVIKKCSYN